MEAVLFLVCAVVILFPFHSERMGARMLKVRPWQWEERDDA